MTNTPSDGGGSNPKKPSLFERLKSENAKKGSGKKKVLIGAVAVGAIYLVKFVIGLGVGVGMSETEVQLSRSEPWSKEMKKGFVEGCAEEAIKEDPKSAPAMNMYCGCVADKIEGAHILYTKYNTLRDTEESLSEKNGQLVAEYMDSDVGKKTIDECLDKAKKIRKTASRR